MVKKVLHLKQVKQRTGLSSSEIYRRMALGLFPRQIHVGSHRVVWLEDEIDGWFALRLSNSPDSQIKEAVDKMMVSRQNIYMFGL
ncbi:MAG: AlpA family phage regulatory protein [Burkholderiaceae bacterium]|nr:AlpA family phage regulatory protein [Burkholderiaceae bacterium]